MIKIRQEKSCLIFLFEEYLNNIIVYTFNNSIIKSLKDPVIPMSRLQKNLGCRARE